MRTKTAGMFVVAILAMSATGCAAGTSGAGADSAMDVPSPELADDEMALSEEDSASRPSNEAAPTTAREFNGTEPNLTNRSNGGQRNDPYLPPQAVVPEEPAPLPPTDADTAPSTPPETSERPRPSFPRPTDPVPLLPFPPFGANDTRPGQPADTGNDGTTDADGDDADADADADAEGNPDVNPDAEADADGSPGDADGSPGEADGTADDSGARDDR